MDLFRKLEGKVELKCDPNKFFDIWAHKTYLLSAICPELVVKVELQEGEWGKAGSCLVWHYHVGKIGERANVKKSIREIDEENRSLKYCYHEGIILEKYYKTFKAKMQVDPNDDTKGCTAMWSFEYEKMNKSVQEAQVYMDYVIALAKDIDAYLRNAL